VSFTTYTDPSGAVLELDPRFIVTTYRQRHDDGQLGPESWGVFEVVDDTPVPVVLEGHATAGAALADLRALLADLDTAARQAARSARCAAIIPPPDVVALRHCGEWWAAERGGGCPTCGAAAEPFNPQVSVARLDGKLRLQRHHGPLAPALEYLTRELALDPSDVRVIEDDVAYYTGPAPAASFVDALTRNRWLAGPETPARARLIGAAR